MPHPRIPHPQQRCTHNVALILLVLRGVPMSPRRLPRSHLQTASSHLLLHFFPQRFLSHSCHGIHSTFETKNGAFFVSNLGRVLGSRKFCAPTYGITFGEPAQRRPPAPVFRWKRDFSISDIRSQWCCVPRSGNNRPPSFSMTHPDTTRCKYHVPSPR